VIAPGGTRIDEYYWMKDRDDPEVMEYLEAENAYAESLMAGTGGLRDSLVAEMASRIPSSDTTAAVPYNGFLYRTRFPEGADYPVYERIEESAADGRWTELLDVSVLGSMYGYVDAAGPFVSPDGETAAFAVDTTGSLVYMVIFENITTGDFLADTLEGTDGSLVWASDGRTVFYGLQDSTWRTDRIVRHVLGTAQEQDVVVYQEFDATFWPWVYGSASDEYIFINTSSSTSSEVWYLDSDNPSGEFRVVQPRTPAVEYGVTGLGDSLFILTNLDAVDFRLMRCAPPGTGIGDWVEVVPGRRGFLIEDFEVFPSGIALVVRDAGIMKLMVLDRASRTLAAVAGEDEPSGIWLTGNSEPERDVVRYAVSTLEEPTSIFEHGIRSGGTTRLRTGPVGGGFDPAAYESRVTYATAPDGRMVPVSMVWRPDACGDGPRPLVLYGYGAYGYSNDPWFSSSRLSLLDRGFVFAIAHVRGGSEMGRSWYEEGRLLSKRNTFTDFVACAEHLVREGITSTDMLFAMGESAGGLLVGAVVTMRPDLFRGAIAGVPFVDVVTTMLDPSIPLTTNEYEEWGNPSDPVYYDYMLSYSPYDNIRAADYPAMLLTAGWNDTQVSYWEPAKFVARMRALRTDDDMLLLRTDLGSGHGGKSGRFGWLEDMAFEYAFLVRCLGRPAI
jgi:oligopeptidase B